MAFENFFEDLSGMRPKDRPERPSFQQAVRPQSNKGFMDQQPTPHGDWGLRDPVSGYVAAYGSDEAMKMASGQSYLPPPVTEAAITGHRKVRGDATAWDPDTGAETAWGKSKNVATRTALSGPVRGTWHKARKSRGEAGQQWFDRYWGQTPWD